VRRLNEEACTRWFSKGWKNSVHWREFAVKNDGEFPSFERFAGRDAGLI
jgi:hypothetical protein